LPVVTYDTSGCKLLNLDKSYWAHWVSSRRSEWYLEVGLRRHRLFSLIFFVIFPSCPRWLSSTQNCSFQMFTYSLFMMLRNLWSSPNIIRMSKLRCVGSAGHVEAGKGG
jgi:hypothetical protein